MKSPRCICLLDVTARSPLALLRLRATLMIQREYGHELEGKMKTVLLVPGEVRLPTWREIYRGAPAVLGPASQGVIEASAEAVAAIVGRGEPVYGINTGFGKLA